MDSSRFGRLQNKGPACPFRPIHADKAEKIWYLGQSGGTVHADREKYETLYMRYFTTLLHIVQLVHRSKHSEDSCLSIHCFIFFIKILQQFSWMLLCRLGDAIRRSITQICQKLFSLIAPKNEILNLKCICLNVEMYFS